MLLNGVKNIIFDLGGVIINLDESATHKALEQLFIKHFKELQEYLSKNNTLQHFELGKITSNDFINTFKKFDVNITEKQLINAWNAMLLDIPDERIFLIRKLSKNYRIFILSNTNQIHLEHINKLVNNNFGFDSLSHLFEKAYYSHQIGLRKPNPAIFKIILKDKNLLPEETLFIDDTKQHILSAKQLNLKTHHLKPNEDIVTLFNENK